MRPLLAVRATWTVTGPEDRTVNMYSAAGQSGDPGLGGTKMRGKTAYSKTGSRHTAQNSGVYRVSGGCDWWVSSSPWDLRMVIPGGSGRWIQDCVSTIYPLEMSCKEKVAHSLVLVLKVSLFCVLILSHLKHWSLWVAACSYLGSSKPVWEFLKEAITHLHLKMGTNWEQFAVTGILPLPISSRICDLLNPFVILCIRGTCSTSRWLYLYGGYPSRKLRHLPKTRRSVWSWGSLTSPKLL